MAELPVSWFFSMKEIHPGVSSSADSVYIIMSMRKGSLRSRITRPRNRTYVQDLWSVTRMIYGITRPEVGTWLDTWWPEVACSHDLRQLARVINRYCSPEVGDNREDGCLGQCCKDLMALTNELLVFIRLIGGLSCILWACRWLAKGVFATRVVSHNSIVVA